MIKINQFSQLKGIAWNLSDHIDEINEEEALSLYERNWRFIDQNSLSKMERDLIEKLRADYLGAGSNSILNSRFHDVIPIELNITVNKSNHDT